MEGLLIGNQQCANLFIEVSIASDLMGEFM